MSQSEQSTAPTKPDPANNAGSNGHPETVNDQKEYQALQEKINHQIQTIDLILADYYKKYFPRFFHDGMERSLFKWNISRNEASSQLEVFFRRHPKPTKDDHRVEADVHRAAAAGSTNAPVLREMSKVAPSTDINTYDEVGTPPSGPVPKNN